MKGKFGNATLSLLLATAVILGGQFFATPASALPSYARQTGQTCSTCHLGFPELTPFGRDFKLNGYVWGGGNSKIPPIAVMLQPAFTHTDVGQPGGAAPPRFGANDNFALQQASLFYGGAISTKLGIGAFAQMTYDMADNAIAWDNVDIRFAHTGTFDGKGFVYGLTLNNTPTVQDLWNTTPAWRFPYSSSELAPAPAAATMLEGAWDQQVVGLGGYMKWNDLIYMELTGYRTLSQDTQKFFGSYANDNNSISGISPYWRFALEPRWGKNSLELGTFGMQSSMYPGRVRSNGTDSLTDAGFDAQYQFIGNRDAITAQVSYILEWQKWGASFPLGNTGRRHSSLRSFNAKLSYLYDQTIGASIGYFNISGSKDRVLYAPDPIDGSANGSPLSDGLIAEIDYMPFNKGGPSFWPWLNAKFSLQYIAYNRFNGASTNYDGSGRNASDNNTLFLNTWIAF